MRAPGVALPPGRDQFAANWNVVDVAYFATLGVPLVSGREFTSADRAGAPAVAIVSETGARRLWPGADPIGQFIQWPDAQGSTTFQIVGVARDLKFGDIGIRERGSAGPSAPPIVVYVPFQQRHVSQVAVFLRMEEGRRAGALVGATLGAIDPRLSQLIAEPLERRGDGPVQLQLRVAASVAGSVGLVGVLLAALGVYGVTAYTVARRTREIGIRIAMGARPGDIVKMVLVQGMTVVGMGATVGLAMAVACSRLFSGLLYGAPPFDPLVYGGAALLLAIVGTAACAMPARRAVQIDAIEALRYE